MNLEALLSPPSAGLSSLFQRVLDLAENYSLVATAAMEEREDTLHLATSILRGWLATGPAPARLDGMSLGVKQGGRQSNFGPVPWIRIFSPAHSPNATQGFYLVYLFAADGSAVYLSLNQGTSEFRSGKMRPAGNEGQLVAQAGAARQRFSTWSVPAVVRSVESISLETGSQPVGAESRKRAANYEAANVLALRYPTGSIPADAVLLADLDGYLDLVAELYLGGVEGTGLARAQRSGGGQRYLSDVRARRACENRAMNLATSHYQEAGWDVDDVSRYQPFDLLCRRTGAEKHVEVKGTTTAGSEILLTKNEVRHAQEYPDVSLALVHGIVLLTSSGEVTADHGELVLLDPWVIEPGRLTPVQLSYRL